MIRTKADEAVALPPNNLTVSTEDSMSGFEPKRLFQRGPDGRFDDCAFVEGFDSRLDGRSLVAADLDGDGDLDLLMTTRNGPHLQLFENVGAPGNAFELELHSVKGHPEADGAVVHVEGVGAFPVLLNRGYSSSVDPTVHVGLGARREARVRVQWRSGVTEDVGVVAAGARVRATEGSGAVERVRAFTEGRRLGPRPFPSRVTDVPVPTGTGPVVVQLFMESCQPCRDEVPALNALSKQGVRVFGLGLHDAAALPKVRERLKMTYAVARLPDAVAEAFESGGGLALPTLLVYGADGVLTRVIAGAGNLPPVLNELKLSSPR